jgi:hypothetical protein
MSPSRNEYVFAYMADTNGTDSDPYLVIVKQVRAAQPTELC